MDKFLILRSLPGLIEAAYTFENKNANHNFLQRFYKKFCLFFSIIKNTFIKFDDFQRTINTDKLREEFKKIRHQHHSDSKPICVYVVEGSNDGNGAILGNNLVYYHLYKIKLLSKHYNVFPSLVSSVEQLNKKLSKHKAKVNLIDMVAHGNNERVGSILLENCKLQNISEDGQMILDACSTASEEQSIATKIAQENNIEVFACEAPLFFSKPHISDSNDHPRVEKVSHGFCIYEPYWMKKIDKPISSSQCISE